MPKKLRNVTRRSVLPRRNALPNVLPKKPARKDAANLPEPRKEPAKRKSVLRREDAKLRNPRNDQTDHQ